VDVINTASSPIFSYEMNWIEVALYSKDVWLITAKFAYLFQLLL
jgi:hypothetical protein